MARLRPKLTYANVMVTLLAFVVLCGGAAYAAGKLGKNSVGAKQLRRNSVTSAKVKDGTLRTQDFATGVLGGSGGQSPVALGHGYVRFGQANYDVLGTSLYGTTPVTLPVPAGPYFATASIQVQDANANPDTVSCRLINGVGGAGSFAASGDQDVRGDGSVDYFTLSGVFEVTSGQALNLECSKGSGVSGARITEASITAVQVGAATFIHE
jgi:hypothetical protein